MSSRRACSIRHPSQNRCAGTRLAFAVFEACYRADAPTAVAAAAALLLPDANAPLDARCEALAGAAPTLSAVSRHNPAPACGHAVWVGLSMAHEASCRFQILITVPFVEKMSIVAKAVCHLFSPTRWHAVMARAAQAWQEERCGGDDDDAEAQVRLWSEPAVDALLSSLTHVRCLVRLRRETVLPSVCEQPPG